MHYVSIELHCATLLKIDFVIRQQHLDDPLSSITASGHKRCQYLSIVFEEFLKVIWLRRKIVIIAINNRQR